uniref:Origin recognition complex subunit 2 winged-helix domain-containing protein n=1 Tax=Proboscia inermis TaxID=420281 RepID=A0A7S0GAY7_9STRA|mmetsp:Transcript_27770/g.28165  ORF Transcript_27770/g.28165 Transcript_27770/m.28165 type:complete len:221 (+) Transcript_27770:287-949(+)
MVFGCVPVLITLIRPLLCGKPVWNLNFRGNTNKRNRVSKMYQDVTTYEPCLVEIRDGMHLDESLCKQTKQTHDQNQTQTNTSNNAVQSSNLAVVDVLESLAPRHAEVLDSLARMQMGLAMNTTDTPQTPSSSNGGHAVDYGVFKEHCAARMISSSEKHLREMLKELIDHGLVESVRPTHETRQTPHTSRRYGITEVRVPKLCRFLIQYQLQLILEYASER